MDLLMEVVVVVLVVLEPLSNIMVVENVWVVLVVLELYHLLQAHQYIMQLEVVVMQVLQFLTRGTLLLV